MKRYGSTTCAAVAQKRAGDKVTVVGMVSALRERMNKEKGTRFGFVTLEDLTGTVEVICWASRPGQNGRPPQKGWADWEHFFKADEPVLVQGEVKINSREEENPRAEITATEVLPLAAVRTQKTSEVAMRIDADRLTRDRAGDLDTLTQLCQSAAIRLAIVPPLERDGAPVSSSRVRNALLAGDVRRAGELLGRPYRLRGGVGTGAKRGRTLGFPTANLEKVETLIPGDGVYAVRALVDGQPWRGAANVGGGSDVMMVLHVEPATKDALDAVMRATEESCLPHPGRTNEVVCAATPEPFYAVGLWYEDFSQTSDEEVHELLAAASGGTTNAGVR